MILYHFVGLDSNEGLEFGLDSVTPVTFKFYEKRPAHILYHWALPGDITLNPEFIKFVGQNPTVTMSYRELRERLSVFREKL